MLTRAEIRLRPPSRVIRCSTSQASQASVPWMRTRRGSSTTADRYPMVAMMPLSRVAEGHCRLSLHQPADLVRGVLAHLQGGLGQLRQRMVLDERDVTDREDPVVPGDPEIGSGPLVT